MHRCGLRHDASTGKILAFWLLSVQKTCPVFCLLKTVDAEMKKPTCFQVGHSWVSICQFAP